MATSKGSLRFVFRRTPEMEAFIQEFWALRPDLRDKPAKTAYEAFRLALMQMKQGNTIAAPISPAAEPVVQAAGDDADEEWE